MLPRPKPGSRVSLGAVARQAGVSLMTASYAMRNHPKIPPRTRSRVQAAAKKIGYVPNPEIGRLMHLIRSGNSASYQATLAFLSIQRGVRAATDRYTLEVVEGARARAGELGYAVDILNIGEAEMSRERLTTMIRTRGIRGILIPPLPTFYDCSGALDWSQFSIIAASYSAQNLPVNRVMPHHLNNIIRAIGELRALGYRRPGFVLSEHFIHRANYAYHATLALNRQEDGFVPILALDEFPADRRRAQDIVGPWLREHRPDVLLTQESMAPMLASVLGRSHPGKVGICALDHGGTGSLAGIHQHPFIIGETAVELLAGQVLHGRIGFEKHPQVTMVEGSWLPGASIRPAEASNPV